MRVVIERPYLAKIILNAAKSAALMVVSDQSCRVRLLGVWWYEFAD
jgi:hypothetical protein